MALSASYDFTLDRDGIVTAALRMLGAVSSGQAPTADELADGGEVLNLMLKAWQADGMQLWTITTIALTPVQGQYKYTFGPSGDIDTGATGPRPEEIFSISRRHTTDVRDITMTRVAREDYYRFSDKDTEGMPTQYYFEPSIVSDLANLYIWPSPDAAFASDYTLQIRYQKPFDDMDAATNNLAFPKTWELAIVTGLAALLAIEYGTGLNERRDLRELAAQEKERVMNWDTEHVSVFLTPDARNATGSWGSDR